MRTVYRLNNQQISDISLDSITNLWCCRFSFKENMLIKKVVTVEQKNSEMGSHGIYQLLEVIQLV